MLKMIVVPIVIGMLSISVHAQVVRGYVKDSLTQTPLPGATIVVGSNGTSTDENGFFQVKEGEAEVRFIGYKTT